MQQVHTIDVDIYVCFHFFPSPYVALSLDSGYGASVFC